MRVMLIRLNKQLKYV